MAFNAQTYRANKYRRKAWEELAQARQIKDRVVAGVAYDWEKPRISTLVTLAKSSMRLYLLMRPS